MELEEVARKFALRNAVEHEGTANPGSVIGQIINDAGAEPQEAQEIAGKIVSEVNQMSLEEQTEKLQSYEFEEKEHEHDPIPDLNVDEDEEVVVRFAPNPNGPPHLGHARGMTINGELRDKYDGKLILRYDDTDPVTKRPLKQAYEMYAEDFEWLGYKPDEIRYSSKNFDTYIEYAEKLIEKGKAYVCKCSQEEGQKYRNEGEACPHRDQSAEENMDLWSQMKDGGLDEGEATLKIKTDIEHKNPAVRDFVAFRIIEDPDHPITGDEYRVWPMLDFAGGIEDHVMGTTHIVRGKDLRASTDRQKYVYDYFGWEYPDVRYWGTVQVSGFDAPMSTSTIAEMVADGELEGWDDPRCGTLRALRKRGFQPEAIREFFIEMGVTEKDAEASVETLESKNRDIVESSSRHFFVENPVEIEITGFPEDKQAILPLHPDHPDRGDRNIELDRENNALKILIEKQDLEDGFMRLKGLCNIEVDKDTAEFVEGDHTEAVERDAPIVHWLPASSPEATLVYPDGSEVSGKIEKADIEIGEVIQFERVGFARKDADSEYYFTHR
ncbi:glutamate--tRNA ligase [Candidatus Nanohalococcus occultus]|uniref:glutamate--tRNA ligase n=1 Tax=Candidatus Nanohalococcus occultus TaxID=2978047 RepID=UPI0039E0695D